MKVLFLDHDGVICLFDEWGSRFKKRAKVYGEDFKSRPNSELDIPIEMRFDNFNKKAIKILNQIIEESGCDIVVSSDWRLYCDIDEMSEYYISKGILKKPIGFTEVIDSGFKKYKENRVIEINNWVNEHKPDKWVAVDDLDLSKLDNFVLTPISTEGIKQSGIKEKILKLLI